MLNNIKTIVYFGDFNPAYSRNRILIKGLQENGIEILWCNENKLKGWKKYLSLIKKIKALPKDFDLLIVGYSDSRAMVPLAKLFFRKPIVWDAFYSLYENWVNDRKLAGPKSLKAKYYWFLDWFSCVLADRILLTTFADIVYFIKTFRILRQKFIRVLVGFSDDIIYPREKNIKSDAFTVGYHGRYIPVLGTRYIILAAKILAKENIKFFIIGDGQDYGLVKKLAEELNLDNIDFIPVVNFIDLPQHMAKADIYLGLLSDIPRAFVNIPNKIFEAMAMKKPTINIKSPAIEEVFKDGEDIILCQPANPQDLAKSILLLKNNLDLRRKICNNAYNKVQQIATPRAIAKDLLSHLILINKI
ncbi:MAG: glycosyltransferase [Candidatus Komeilibacteria bacterium]|nr:glycosyltransferase [Candidatus Komeilibacteria bacterium]